MLAEDIKSERLGAGVDCIDNAADIVIFDHWQNRPENFFPRNCHFGVGPPDQRWREIFLIRIADPAFEDQRATRGRSEEHTSELQSLMRISYAVFCLKKKKSIKEQTNNTIHNK